MDVAEVGNNLVVVAIPSEDDYINKISSEKVPHLTLLSLGEVKKVKNLNLILDFVKHAADHTLNRFHLEVDRRGTLGPNLADVLFFSKSKWSGFNEINSFRSNLLKNDNIRTAYDSTEQFPEWVPHITLGFPDTPANPDQRDYPGINHVCFDRIAVWFADSEGIEFPLKAHDWDDVAMVMSNGTEAVEDILEHHGIKGMKWGVRKEQVHPNIAHIPKKTRKEAAKDAEEFTRAKLFFGEGAGTRRKLIKAKVESKKVKDPFYAKAFDHFVKSTDLGQRASQARTQRKRKDVTKRTKRTAKKVVRVFGPQLANHLHTQVGPHSYGDRTRRFGLDHTALILEHHGIKGMKWGVRRKATVGAQEVVISDRRKKLKTSGGQGHPAHPDAVRARTVEQIAKKSGHKALSNKELQDFNQRLNLEQQAKRLTLQDKSAGKRFVLKLIGKNVDRGVQEGGKAALNSHFARKKMAIGAAALALA